MIGRQELAEIADEEVLDAVAVEVGHCDVRRVVQLREDIEGGVRRVRPAEQHHPVAHVGREQLQPAVAVEVDEPDVCHRRIRRRRRRG